jgi:hypothetical protein
MGTSPAFHSPILPKFGYMSKRIGTILFLVFPLVPLFAGGKEAGKAQDVPSLFTVLYAQFQLVKKEFFTAFFDAGMEEEVQAYLTMKALRENRHSIYPLVNGLRWILKALPTILLLVCFFLILIWEKAKRIGWVVLCGLGVWMLWNASVYRYRQAESLRKVDLLSQMFPEHAITKQVMGAYHRNLQMLDEKMAKIRADAEIRSAFPEWDNGEAFEKIQRSAMRYGWFSALSTFSFYVVLWSVLLVLEWGLWGGE